MHPTPLLFSTDVVIFGSSSAAVAAAIAAHEQQASVVVISDRPHFGSDVAGNLSFLDPEPAGAAAFISSLWRAGRQEGKVSPGAIKHHLEKLLLDRNIPFLFQARPVAILEGQHRPIAGLLIAARTALYAVEGKTFIDASPTGLLARLAGMEPTYAEEFSLTVFSRQPDLPGATSLAVPIDYPRMQGCTYAHRFFRKNTARNSSSINELAALEGALRSTILDPSIIYQADAWRAEKVTGSPVISYPHDNLCIILTDGYPAEEVSRLASQQGQFFATKSKEIPADALPDVPLDHASTYGFVSSFHRGSLRTVQVRLPVFPVLGSIEVAIAGGGTGGAPAGIAAARAGASTIILEAQRALGGVGTTGTISCYYFGNRVGFTKEIDDTINTIDPTHGGTGKDAIWNPELKAARYLQALSEAGGQAWLGSFGFGVHKIGSRVKGILVSTPWGAGLLEAGCIIDSSGNADIAAAAGAPCRSVDARHIAVQGAGLSPRRPQTPNVNSDFTFIDDDDVAGVTHAFVHARARFAGDFDTIPFINTRERRQIHGEIELSPLDFLTQRAFPDTITVARSNFDTHGYTVHPVFMITPPDHKPLHAHVPYRCLIPKGIDGVLVTGLGMSAHRDALPVIRMQADVQNQGYAAGYAAYLSTREKCAPRAIPFSKLQAHLIEIGILPEEAREWSDHFPLSVSEIEAAAWKTPADIYHTSLLLAHPEVSRPALLHVVAESTDPLQQEECALLLGLLGESKGAPFLASLVQSRDWDEGWNYRGMGQFGMSCSRLDSLIIALGRTRSPLAVEPILAKINSLDKTAAFSHCRAVAVAAISLNHPQLTEALSRLLKFPTFRGHAVRSTKAAIAVEPVSPPPPHEQGGDCERFLRCEAAPRSDALRELYLAKALYLCCDTANLGATILQEYSNDLRGPFARHTQSILAETDIERLREETI